MNPMWVYKLAQSKLVSGNGEHFPLTLTKLNTAILGVFFSPRFVGEKGDPQKKVRSWRKPKMHGSKCQSKSMNSQNPGTLDTTSGGPLLPISGILQLRYMFFMFQELQWTSSALHVQELPPSPTPAFAHLLLKGQEWGRKGVIQAELFWPLCISQCIGCRWLIEVAAIATKHSYSKQWDKRYSPFHSIYVSGLSLFLLCPVLLLKVYEFFFLSFRFSLQIFRSVSYTKTSIYTGWITHYSKCNVILKRPISLAK